MDAKNVHKSSNPIILPQYHSNPFSLISDSFPKSYITTPYYSAFGSCNHRLRVFTMHLPADAVSFWATVEGFSAYAKDLLAHANDLLAVAIDSLAHAIDLLAVAIDSLAHAIDLPAHAINLLAYANDLSADANDLPADAMDSLADAKNLLAYYPGSMSYYLVAILNDNNILLLNHGASLPVRHVTPDTKYKTTSISILLTKKPYSHVRTYIDSENDKGV